MGGVVVHWDGTGWTVVENVPSMDDGDGDTDLLAVWASGPSDVWAVGLNDTIVHWDGDQWSNVVAMDTANLEGVWGSSPDDVWILDQNGAVLRGNTSGFSAVSLPASGGDSPFAIWGTSASDVWIIASSSDGSPEPALVHWDGASFTVSRTDSEDFAALGGSGPGDVWLVGAGGQIMHHG
jgi:hypothetical protein